MTQQTIPGYLSEKRNILIQKDTHILMFIEMLFTLPKLLFKITESNFSVYQKFWPLRWFQKSDKFISTRKIKGICLFSSISKTGEKLWLRELTSPKKASQLASGRVSYWITILTFSSLIFNILHFQQLPIAYNGDIKPTGCCFLLMPDIGNLFYWNSYP